MLFYSKLNKRTLMDIFYSDVPGLGIVVLTNHAKNRMIEQGIQDGVVKKALFEPSSADIPDSPGVIFRDKGEIRIVLTSNTDFKADYVVKTVYRMGRNKKSSRMHRTFK